MGELFLRAWLKSLLWVSFVQFYLYSILNQRDKLFREKILQSTLSEKKENFSAGIKKGKDFWCYTVAIFQLSRNQREDLIERIV